MIQKTKVVIKMSYTDKRLKEKCRMSIIRGSAPIR